MIVLEKMNNVKSVFIKELITNKRIYFKSAVLGKKLTR